VRRPLNGGSAPQSAASSRSLGWRATLSDPAVLAVGIYASIAMLAAVAAYFAVFTSWAEYDDEGTLLVTLQAFAHGDILYRDIYSPYGPFYYELFGGLFALTGADVTTDASRSIVLVLWVGTSLLFGIACQRLTGRLLLGAAGMIAAFGTLYVLTNEPMHPQVLCVVLLGAFVLLAAFGPGRRPQWSGAVAGAILAALFLTKVNLGVYAVAAVVLAGALACEPLRERRWLSWPAIAAVLVMPLVVAGKDLEVASVREMVAVQVLAMGALAVAAWPQRSRGEDDGSFTWVLGAAGGFTVAFVAIMLAIVLNGSSPADVYDGIVTEAMRVRDVAPNLLPMSPAVVDWAVFALAGAALARMLGLGARGGGASIWPGLLRAVAGLAIWLSVVRFSPVSLSPSAGNPDSLATVLAWIVAIPPAGVVEPPYKRFLRVLLPALAIAEVMQVYPVAGSQMGIAALTFVPVGALLLGDALTSLRQWADSRGLGSPADLRLAATVVLAALTAVLAVNVLLRPLSTNATIYHDQPALPFEGATLLHPSPERVEEYTRLVELLHRYDCTDFIGYPNVNSLYLWSGIEPPPPDAPGAWIRAVDSERQQRIVNELRASPRPCAIRNDALAPLWLGGKPPPDRPLVNYVLNEFRTVARVGEFQFMLPR
jgi:hypothetical protein